MNVSLKPPNQVREAGNIVDVVPKQLTQSRLLNGTYIYELGLTTPFKLRGMMSYYTTRAMKGKDLLQLSLMQVETVTGNFRGFSRSSCQLWIWKGYACPWKCDFFPQQKRDPNTEKVFGVDSELPNHGYNDVLGMQVQGCYSSTR